MATPCNSQLQKAPFDTYRDPETGEWKLERKQIPASTNSGNVIPFRRPLESLPLVVSQAK